MMTVLVPVLPRPSESFVAEVVLADKNLSAEYKAMSC